MDLFLSKVSPDKRRKIAKFVRREDAYRSLLGDLLVRAAIIRQTHLKNHEIRFAYNEYGKPFLQGCRDFSFNISHSGNWAVMICGKGCPCLGIDVEQIVPIDIKIAESFFSPQERMELIAKTGQAQAEYFYRLWTLKESYLKAVGKGLSMPLDSVSFTYTMEDGWHLPEAGYFHFRSFKLDHAHILSACSSTDAIPDQPDFVSLTYLYESLKNAE